MSGMAAGNQKGFVWMARLSGKSAGNYQNPSDGKVFGSSFNELNYSGMLGLAKNWGYSRLYISSFNQAINIIDGARDLMGRFTKTVAIDGQAKVITADAEDLNSRNINAGNAQLLNNYKISTNNYFALGKGSITANLSYALNQRQEFANVLLPDQPDLFFYLQTYYYDVRYNFAEKNGFETTIGSNGMQQSMQNKGLEVLYPNFRLFDNGLFVFVKKSLPKLKMSGGIRYDTRQLKIEKLFVDNNGRFQSSPQNSVETRFEGLNKQFGNITASFGMVYDLKENLKIKLNLGRGFRAPSVPEISSNGEHAGTFRFEYGNINQASEVAFQTDLGLTYDTKNLYFDLNFFQNSIQQYSYSERVQKDGRDLFINNVPAYRYVQGNARLRGIEATFTINPAHLKWLSFTQNYSLVRGVNRSAIGSDAKFLPFMPPPRWISQLKITKNNWRKWFRNLYAQAELEIHQAQNQALLANNTETNTPSYNLINIGFGGDLLNANKQTLFSVYFSLNNATDAVYQNHQNRLKYLELNPVSGQRGIYNMGRNLSIKLLIPFLF
jgi:iron complex outermembrane receptor protein